MSYVEDVVTGLAQLFEDEGIGSWATTGAYPSNAVGIVVGDLPLSPSNVIGITPYPVVRPGEVARFLGVQLRFRAADQRVLWERSEVVDALLDGRGLTVLNGRVITGFSRVSAGPVESAGPSDLPELVSSFHLVTDQSVPFIY